MAATSLLALIDDIATLLDDVAVMSKVAAKKTAGVLGDDLALNAQQVAGVAAERELPVVWAVARGSFRNKLILVPAALLISALVPALVMPLLMIGGAYLCFEGAEKLAHRLFHREQADAEDGQLHAALADPTVDLVAFERDKIRGAIRTDFILSAEIIVIALGTVAAAPLLKQVGVLASLSVLMTVGVYGLVAAIVKLDDVGLYLSKRTVGGVSGQLLRALGAGLVRAAPKLMRALSVAGTAAMFLVGGSILLHGLPIEAALSSLFGGPPGTIGGLLLEGGVGVLAGSLIVAVVELISRLRTRR